MVNTGIELMGGEMLSVNIVVATTTEVVMVVTTGVVVGRTGGFGGGAVGDEDSMGGGLVVMLWSMGGDVDDGIKVWFVDIISTSTVVGETLMKDVVGITLHSKCDCIDIKQ